MNTTIYEAVAKYKKDDTLPYTEYFSLGDFSTKDLAENAIMLAKQLPGFRAFCDENFYIEEFVLNDGVPRNYSVDDLIKNNEVFNIHKEQQEHIEKAIFSVLRNYSEEDLQMVMKLTDDVEQVWRELPW